MDYKPSVFNLEIPYQGKKLIYNTYSGALSFIEESLESIEREDLIAALAKQGFFVDKRINEVNRVIVERKRELFTYRIKHLHIEVAPTMQCQAHCWYCFEGGCSREEPMTQQVVLDTIDFIKKRILLSCCEEMGLLFFGGEPLLASKQVIEIGSEIKKFCDERGIVFHSEIISNGIAFSPQLADILIPQINLTRLQITLDGLENTHDSAKGIPCFKRVLKNIVANAEKTDISIRLNVSSKNKDEIPTLVHILLDEFDLDGKIRIYLARVDDLDSCGLPGEGCLDNYAFVDFRNNLIRDEMRTHTSFIANDLLPDIKRNYCGYEKISQVMIGPKGELYRCQRTMGNPSNAIGDIYTGSFYSDDELSLFRPLDPKCLECNLLPTCFGGCPNERRKGKPISYCNLKRVQIEKDLLTYVKIVTNS